MQFQNMVSEAALVDREGEKSSRAASVSWEERRVVPKPWLPSGGGEEHALLCWSCASELCLCAGVTMPGGTSN